MLSQLASVISAFFTSAPSAASGRSRPESLWPDVNEHVETILEEVRIFVRALRASWLSRRVMQLPLPLASENPKNGLDLHISFPS